LVEKFLSLFRRGNAINQLNTVGAMLSIVTQNNPFFALTVISNYLLTYQLSEISLLKHQDALIASVI